MNGILLSCSTGAPHPHVVASPSQSPDIPDHLSSVNVLWTSGTIANKKALLDAKLLLSDRQQSDNLVIGRLYAGLKDRVAERIAGNCSFIIWDRENLRLFCVRDRIGSNGIYFAIVDSKLFVSNRIELLLKQLESKPRPNTSSMVAHINGLAPAPSETFYDGIYALNAGETLAWQGGLIERRVYWAIASRPILKLNSDAEYSAAYREALLEVVPGYGFDKKYAISVSSGLDSTSIAATLRLTRPYDEMSAITWTAPETEDADETGPAESVCRYLNLECSQIRADIHHPMSSHDGIRTSVESPFLNFYHDTWQATFEQARSLGAAVLVTGHSGDSLFGGFVTPYSDLLLSGQITRLFDQIAKHRRNTGESTAAIVLRMTLRPIAGAYLPANFRRRLRKPAVWMRPEHLDAFRGAISRNVGPARRLLPGRSRRLTALCHPLAPFIEELQFRHAQDCGVEWRCPLADHRLIEFAASLPTEQTFADGMDKMIVRRGQAGFLPEEVINLKSKIVPSSILRRSFEKRRAKLEELTTGMRAAEIGLVDERLVEESVRSYLAHGKSTELFWYVLTLEDWLRRYF